MFDGSQRGDVSSLTQIPSPKFLLPELQDLELWLQPCHALPMLPTDHLQGVIVQAPAYITYHDRKTRKIFDKYISNILQNKLFHMALQMVFHNKMLERVYCMNSAYQSDYPCVVGCLFW